MPHLTQTSPLKKTLKWTQNYKVQLGMAVLVLFYGVGLWGMGFSDSKAYFQALVPFNLLLTAAVLFIFHQQFSKWFLLVAAAIAMAGFLAEVLGIHTGLLFGNYSYGKTLGWQLWQVPVIIGLNWLMLVYSSGHIVHKFIKIPLFLKAVAGALLMVLLDFFIEPVAVKFDFWSWQNNHIPASNFLGWFIVAFLMQLLFLKAPFPKNNPIAPFVYVVQLLFFMSLFLVI